MKNSPVSEHQYFGGLVIDCVNCGRKINADDDSLFFSNPSYDMEEDDEPSSYSHPGEYMSESEIQLLMREMGHDPNKGEPTRLDDSERWWDDRARICCGMEEEDCKCVESGDLDNSFGFDEVDDWVRDSNDEPYANPSICGSCVLAFTPECEKYVNWMRAWVQIDGQDSLIYTIDGCEMYTSKEEAEATEPLSTTDVEDTKGYL